MVEAFYLMNRGRRYIEGAPLNLSIADISEYVAVYDPPFTRYEFDACVMALDNHYIDDVMTKK